MIKPGKACSQLMKANNTSETNIKVVGNIFRLTFVFNDLKPSLNLYMSSPIVLNLFLIFEIRGVISVNTCLEGGNLVNLTIHAPWYIMGCPPTSFIKPHAKYKHGGGQPRLCFAGISWTHVRQGSMEVTQSENIKWKEQ
jgi:hypothetical protein